MCVCVCVCVRVCVCVSCLSGLSQWQSVFCHFFSVPRLSHFMLPCAGYYSQELWKSWPCALKHLTLSLSCPLSHPPLLLAAHSRSPGLEAPFPERTQTHGSVCRALHAWLPCWRLTGFLGFYPSLLRLSIFLLSSLLLSHRQQLDSGLPPPPVIPLSRKP